MKRIAAIDTPRGEVEVCAFAAPEEIRNLRFDRQFREHTHYRSLYTRRESLIMRASQTDANVVLALANVGSIIGFGVLVYPDPHERWAAFRSQLMMEVKAIEVGREWRGLKIGDALVEGMLSHPKIEEKIAYFVGYHWTWDLEGLKITASQYRKMMVNLFKPYGFVEAETNEPNICLSPDNVFMSRIGKEVSEAARNDFKWIRYGIYP